MILIFFIFTRRCFNNDSFSILITNLWPPHEHSLMVFLDISIRLGVKLRVLDRGASHTVIHIITEKTIYLTKTRRDSSVLSDFSSIPSHLTPFFLLLLNCVLTTFCWHLCFEGLVNRITLFNHIKGLFFLLEWMDSQLLYWMLKNLKCQEFYCSLKFMVFE